MNPCRNQCQDWVSLYLEQMDDLNGNAEDRLAFRISNLILCKFEEQKVLLDKTYTLLQSMFDRIKDMECLPNQDTTQQTIYILTCQISALHLERINSPPRLEGGARRLG